MTLACRHTALPLMFIRDARAASASANRRYVSSNPSRNLSRVEWCTCTATHRRCLRVVAGRLAHVSTSFEYGTSVSLYRTPASHSAMPSAVSSLVCRWRAMT
eukprot:5183299-Prymnesium_polylepis.1